MSVAKLRRMKVDRLGMAVLGMVLFAAAAAGAWTFWRGYREDQAELRALRAYVAMQPVRPRLVAPVPIATAPVAEPAAQGGEVARQLCLLRREEARRAGDVVAAAGIVCD